jgi:IS30 family transposase
MQQKRLTQAERYKISFLLEEKKSITEIALRLNRHRTVIHREIKRNSCNGIYCPEKAEVLACERQSLCHRHFKFTSEIRDLVIDRIQFELSPEQVSNYLKINYHLSISTQRIYHFIGEDRAEGGTLYTHLRHGLKKNRTKYGTQDYRGKMKDRVSIDERPSIVDDQSRVGDFEIDTIVGKAHKMALVTVVDRKSLYTLIGKVETRDAKSVRIVLNDLLEPYKEDCHTVTADNGSEFAEHVKVREQLECDFYFAHPYCSWERGCNENTNGLIRQYFRKGTSFDHITDSMLQFVMERLNHRPRKKLGYRTPYEVFHEHLNGDYPETILEDHTVALAA